MKDKFGREKPVHQKKIKAPTKQCNTLLQVWHFATEKPELQRRKKAGPLTDPSMFDKENKDLGTLFVVRKLMPRICILLNLCASKSLQVGIVFLYQFFLYCQNNFFNDMEGKKNMQDKFMGYPKTIQSMEGNFCKNQYSNLKVF